MSFRRVWAVFLRYFYLFARLDQLADLFYWPALEIMLWGITSIWIQQQGTEMPHIAMMILTGIVFWQILWRGNYEVTVNLLEEFWSRNLVNLFSTPLKVSEWMASIMLVGFVKISISMFFGAFLVWVMYTLNVFKLGWAFLPYLASLTLSGWFMGFFTAGFIVYYGKRVQMLAWMMAYVFAPFCAIYYPVEALPHWARLLSKILPMSYIFEGMREVLTNGVFSLGKLMMSFALNAVYLFISLSFFKFMFEKSRDKGLARLE
jgi:ABC-2 type transport system permease protein